MECIETNIYIYIQQTIQHIQQPSDTVKGTKNTSLVRKEYMSPQHQTKRKVLKVCSQKKNR